jgi:peptide/nickel transport system permease protein
MTEERAKGAEPSRDATVLLPPAGGRGAGPASPEEGGAEDGRGRRGRRSRGGVLFSSVLPGLPQLLAGRIAGGGYVLALWLGCVWILLARTDRLLAAPGEGWEVRLAAAVLVLLMAGLWTWSYRDVQREQAREAAGGASPDGQWARAFRVFRRNRMALAGLMTIGVLYLVALLAPLLAPFDPTVQGNLLTHRLTGPSPEHLLGTDQFARDILSRILYGARVSLGIAFVAVGIAVSIGTLLGAVAGFVGGRVDGLIMRFVDMVISFPRLVLLITIIALFRPSLLVIVVVLGLTQWPQVARIVRGEVLSLRERAFIEAGRALGFSRRRILGRHVIPNVLAPVIVAATLGIGDTIILEAILSFLGLGVQPPTPSWGIMVADGRTNLLGAWWIATFSGMAIVLTVLSFNLVGDGLRDAMDPRQGP